MRRQRESGPPPACCMGATAEAASRELSASAAALEANGATASRIDEDCSRIRRSESERSCEQELSEKRRAQKNSTPQPLSQQTGTN